MTDEMQLLNDGTLKIKVANVLGIKRVMVMDDNVIYDSYYPDRPKGEWIDSEKQKISFQKLFDRGEVWKVCSVCGCGYQVGKWVDENHYQRHFANYCPRCGARMEGGTE